MTTYIDPTTELPQNLGEIYSDRNIRIVGQARINPSVANQIDTIGIKVLCTPQSGGAEGVSAITDGSYALSGTGSSLWVKITRSGTVTVTPEIYATGAQPKSRKDYVQVFYQTSSSQIVSISSFLIYAGPLYTRLGYGVGQRTWSAIVGSASDPHATHTDLQTAINDSPNGGRILIKTLLTLNSTVNVTKSLVLNFQGRVSGITPSGTFLPPSTGLLLSDACSIIGCGQVFGFTTGINLGNIAGSRIEMVFSGNTTNINFGTLTGVQYSINGSYGLTQTSHIETSGTHGTISRWNFNTSKRWEPVAGIVVDDSGNTTSTGTIQALQLRGSLPGAGTSVYLTATGMSTLQISHPSAGVARIAVSNGESIQIGDGSDTNITISGAGVVSLSANIASSLYTNGTLVVTGGVGISGALNVNNTITGTTVVGAVYQ